MASVCLKPVHLEALVDDAQTRAPEECCGLLVGSVGEDGEHVETVVPLPNTAATPRQHFAIADADMIREARALRQRGGEIIGFYHSHPSGPPTPSPTDIEQASAFEGMLHIIVGLNGETQLRAWRTGRPRWHSIELRTGD